jgi:P22 coat protein - gene protein 5
MGIDWYAAQNVARHVPGVPGGTPTGTGSAGTTSVSVAAGGNAGTFKKGDIITFANHATTYTVTADVTLNGSGAGVITVSPALTASVSASAITVRAAHAGNIVGSMRGLSMVSVPLEMPMEAMGAHVMTYNGLSVRVVYGYNLTTKVNTISFDTLIGAKVTDPRLLTRFDG